jgi:hypothetical protein
MDASARRFMLLVVCAASVEGCRDAGQGIDLVSKLSLHDIVEVVVAYRQIDGVDPLRITDPGAIQEIKNDFKRAVRGRSAKWQGIAKCTVTRARAGEVIRWIYGRHDDRLGDILIIKTDEGFYEVRGRLLKMMQKHAGRSLL